MNNENLYASGGDFECFERGERRAKRAEQLPFSGHLQDGGKGGQDDKSMRVSSPTSPKSPRATAPNSYFFLSKWQ